MNLGGLTGSRKAICKSRFGHLKLCLYCVWIVLECDYNIKWISVIVTIRSVIANLVTIMKVLCKDYVTYVYILYVCICIILNADLECKSMQTEKITYSYV